MKKSQVYSSYLNSHIYIIRKWESWDTDICHISSLDISIRYKIIMGLLLWSRNKSLHLAVDILYTFAHMNAITKVILAPCKVLLSSAYLIQIVLHIIPWATLPVYNLGKKTLDWIHCIIPCVVLMLVLSCVSI